MKSRFHPLKLTGFLVPLSVTSGRRAEWRHRLQRRVRHFVGMLPVQDGGQLVQHAIHCPGCDQERDRDHNGATLALAALCLINEKRWPPELESAT
ncbi:hypothetical protein EDD21DRAFT_368256 [Dissophora ornata]|nr:hypothetical protein EDD21DRAFT_368256 [Dissophora ornata]